MNGRYKLDGQTPVPCKDLMDWARSMEQDRTVAKTDIGEVHVSTVFLGLDHRFGGGPPLLFETMIFGGEHDEWQDRYSTWDEAKAGHTLAVVMVEKTKPKEEPCTPPPTADSP